MEVRNAGKSCTMNSVPYLILRGPATGPRIAALGTIASGLHLLVHAFQDG